MKGNPFDLAVLNAVVSASGAINSIDRLGAASTMTAEETKKLHAALELLQEVEHGIAERLTLNLEPGTDSALDVPLNKSPAKRSKVFNDAETMRALKRSNEHALLKSIIQCPACNTELEKTRYNTNFCSNKGHGNCKDAFYQTTNPNRHKDRSK